MDENWLYAVKRVTRKTKESRSPALLLIEHVWNHVQEETGHSWQRLNSAMHRAAFLAVEGGLRFELDDFNHISINFRPEYWLDLESIYSAAIKFGNMTACHALEAKLGRPPFVLSGRRLCVGTRLDESVFRGGYGREIAEAPEWLGYPFAELSSFREDKNSFIVVSPITRDGKRHEGHRRTPARRWVVTREDISAANKAVRESKKPVESEPAATAASELIEG